MYEFGSRIAGLTVPVVGALTLGEDKVFQIQIQAREGILDPQGVAQYLVGKLREQYPELEVVWMKVCERYQTIEFQFVAHSREALALAPRVQTLFIDMLLVWLPAILALIGITTIAVSAWQILAGIPWWAWALLGTGIVLFLFRGAISKALTPERYHPK